MKDDIRVCREMTNSAPNEFSLFPKSTLGIDLGDRFCHCCALDYRGDVVERFRFETTKAGLANGEFQGSCRMKLIYAADFSRSGFSLTTSSRSQFRVPRAQRSGFLFRAAA